jgi:hypothetical protein
LLSIALGLIIRIIPAVAAKTSAAQFKNTRHLLQKFTVMGGHQHAALITGKLVVEPRPALSVQMVSGFVQQQIIRLRRKRPAQQGADALAAAEFSGGLIGIKRR